MHSWDADPGLGDRLPDRSWASFDEILAGYPDLERDDIQQALEYAAWLTQDQVHHG